jgi:hypothetical protein
VEIEADMVGASERGIIGAMRSARHLACFFLIGALFFAIERRLASPPPVLVPDASVLAATWARANGVAPDAQLRAQLERDALDEALLAREARRLGLDRGDAVVRERLVSNIAFAGGEDATPEERHREALALRMDETDAVVRRRLAALATARLRAEAARAPIDDAALRAWFEAHRGAYQQPAALRYQQRCFRGADAETRAEATLASLQWGSRDRSAERGDDPCFHGGETPLQSEAELASRYGVDFARSVFAAAAGDWVGPLASSQGWHLVLVRERVAARDPDLEFVRDAVRDAVIAERQERALREGIASLRAGYAAESPR